MKDLTLIIGSIFGFLAVILGAFGAHYLKKMFTEELQKSFETGVKYQMYHAILLVLLGFNLDFTTTLHTNAIIFFIVGVVLFSGSIYGLCISSAKGNKFKFLGPITPLGGLCLLIGWGLLIYTFI